MASPASVGAMPQLVLTRTGGPKWRRRMAVETTAPVVLSDRGNADMQAQWAHGYVTALLHLITHLNSESGAGRLHDGMYVVDYAMLMVEGLRDSGADEKVAASIRQGLEHANAAAAVKRWQPTGFRTFKALPGGKA